ncbi:MAG TPA: DUF4129 domain-containing protein [Alphaproteobacteria bacterium]|nr:DUF4129 domain-containing protein [Alphaproteobacteria bacterium]
MKYRIALLAGYSLLVLGFVAGLPAPAASLTLAEYQQQLRDFSAQIDALGAHPEQAGQVATGIPDGVTVTAGGGEHPVNYKYLKNDLAIFSGADAEKQKALLEQLQRYIHSLEKEAQTYETEASDAAASRARLNTILARREFRSVGGPSAWEILANKIFRWLDRMFSWLFRLGGKGRVVSNALIYVLVGAAFLVLSIWILRRFSKRNQEEFLPREIIPFAPSSRSWRTWLAEARHLAEKQDWRGAIHLAYWAGISFLEERGAWKPNRARTPREYLRLVNAGGQRHQYAPLSDLTSKFEVVWYGQRNAAEPDFQETIRQLARLGCQ